MNRSKSFFTSLLSAFFAAFFVAGAVYAATTISTSISTDGSLTVTGLSALNGQATTSQLSVVKSLYVGGTATTTISGENGNIVAGGTLTLANSSTAINGIVFGVCGWGGSVVVAASSSSAYFDCTGATGLTSSHRTFVQATSSLSASIIVQAASSTAAGTVNVRLVNTSQEPVTLTAFSLNVFGIR